MVISKHQGKFMHKCLQFLIKELRHLQHDLDGKFWIDKFIHNKLITACQNVSACQYTCFKSSNSLAGLINDLQSLITTFNKSHPHQAENYQLEALLNCMRIFHSLLISETVQGTEVDYVIFRLLILDEPAQALSFCQNFEILISAHKSLLINGRWKEREKGKAYENFGGKRSI